MRSFQNSKPPSYQYIKPQQWAISKQGHPILCHIDKTIDLVSQSTIVMRTFESDVTTWRQMFLRRSCRLILVNTTSKAAASKPGSGPQKAEHGSNWADTQILQLAGSREWSRKQTLCRYVQLYTSCLNQLFLQPQVLRDTLLISCRLCGTSQWKALLQGNLRLSCYRHELSALFWRRRWTSVLHTSRGISSVGERLSAY
jgi:hypothetical protein